jgi:dTDP-3-amino-3,4,6-trideoxy-alpha-D-glucose transaminase
MTIPVFDLRRQIASIRTEVDAAFNEVLDSGWFILGRRVEAFEEEFAEYLGVPAAVGVASGTDAISIGLEALGVGPGDEVICTANAGVPPIAAVEATGARAVLVDVDPLSQTLDVAQLERVVTARTKAVLAIHLYGGAADLDGLLDLCQRRGLKLIEDCAQCHGATWHGRRLGSIGDAAAFSFYPTKNLGAYGDGGAVVSRDVGVAERARLLRNYGWRQQYASEIKGSNSRLDELQAAVLSVKLRHLDDWNAARRERAARYDSGLRGVQTPTVRPQSEHVYHLYVVRAEHRDELRAHLAAGGVGTGVHYALPVHLQPAYQNLGLGPGSLPETERSASEVLSLPLYPELTSDEIDRVIQLVNGFVSEHCHGA